jgi:putative peptidoglycan lipid II flippase
VTTAPGATPGARRTLARAAVLIAGITVVARLAGFLRTFVFARTVGSSCVGVVYQTANTVPNIVFDVVAGGTLTALVVPLVAPSMLSGDRRAAGRTVAALLTWALIALCVIAALVIAFAGPITRLLLGQQPCAGAYDLGRRMLIVFAPQIVLYGLAVVLAGTLQATERFSWPAVAPLLSSLVVISAYLIFFGVSPGNGAATALPTSAELVLSIGTTAGVLVLAGSQLPAVLGLRLGLRPTLRFPGGIGGLVRRAAVAGGITLAAQQLATGVMLRLANGGIPGTLVVLTIAQTVYLVPWAVLAVPVATALFPRMSSAWDTAGRDRATQIAANGLRMVVAFAAVGTAMLVASATPVANVLLDIHKDGHSVFAPAIAAFAVGLPAWSAVALLSRVLYAARRPQLAAFGQAFGWAVTIVLDLLIVFQVNRHDRAVVLALGNAAGVTVAAVVLLVVAYRIGALTDVRLIVGSIGTSLLAAAAGSAAGWAVSRLVTNTGVATSIVVGCASAAVGAAVAAAVVALLDRDIVALVRRVRRDG